MGQKQNPIAIRLGNTKSSCSGWYASDKKYAEFVAEDIKLRNFILKKYESAGIDEILITRPTQSAQVKIRCSRPGILIGKRGSDVDKIRLELSSLIDIPVHVTIEEFKKPDLSAKIVSESIASQLKRRIQFRKAMKRAVQNTMRAGAKGIKVMVSGRLNGAEIARSECYLEGRVPLHTFRADIDYNLAEALTTYGIIGVKVWIFRDEILAKKVKNTEAK